MPEALQERDEAMIYTPGDILLVNDYSGQGDLIGSLILDGSQARYGVRRWTHSALIVSDAGGLVEALEGGVERTNVTKYDKVPTKIISPPVPADDPRRAYAVRYALAQVGESYGVLGFVSLAVDLATGLNTSLHVDRTPICSELVSRATESMTLAGYPYSSERMLPVDLDVAWGATHGKAMSIPGRWGLLFKTLFFALNPFKKGIRL